MLKVQYAPRAERVLERAPVQECRPPPRSSSRARTESSRRSVGRRTHGSHASQSSCRRCARRRLLRSRATCSVPTCEPPGGACSMQRVTRRRRRRIGRGTPGVLHGDSRVLYGTPGALQGVGPLQIRSRQLCRDTSFLSQAKFAPHSSPATRTPARTLARTADTHPHEAAKLRQTPASRCTSRGKVYNGWNYTASCTCAFRLESCVAVGRSMGRVCGRLHIPVCCVSHSACHTLLAARRTNSGWSGCTKSVRLTPAMMTF